MARNWPTWQQDPNGVAESPFVPSHHGHYLTRRLLFGAISACYNLVKIGDLQDTTWGLSKKKQRELLLDIDERGGLHNFSLRQLHRATGDKYGGKNSALRWQVQNKVGKWKLLKPSEFAAERIAILREPSTQSQQPSLPQRPLSLARSPKHSLQRRAQSTLSPSTFGSFLRNLRPRNSLSTESTMENVVIDRK